MWQLQFPTSHSGVSGKTCNKYIFELPETSGWPRDGLLVLVVWFLCQFATALHSIIFLLYKNKELYFHIVQEWTILNTIILIQTCQKNVNLKKMWPIYIYMNAECYMNQKELLITLKYSMEDYVKWSTSLISCWRIKTNMNGSPRPRI